MYYDAVVLHTHLQSQPHFKMIWSSVTTWLNHLPFFPFTGLGLPPAFPTMVDNHVGHNSSMAYMGGMEPKPVYPPPQATPSRYSPVPRHMLGEEDFTRSDLLIYSLTITQFFTPGFPRPWKTCRYQGSFNISRPGKVIQKEIFTANIVSLIPPKY